MIEVAAAPRARTWREWLAPLRRLLALRPRVSAMPAGAGRERDAFDGGSAGSGIDRLLRD